MKRTFVLLAAVLLLASCHNSSKDPVVMDWNLGQMKGLHLTSAGVSADTMLELDIDNPSRARYTIESLLAVIYLGDSEKPFADVTANGTADINPNSRQKVSLPLSLNLRRPMALLGGDIEDSDLENGYADIDLTISKGGMKKRIKKEHVPLKDLRTLLENHKTKTDEKV